MKVLVAEDDENSRCLLRIILSAQGYEVVCFENGAKALAHLQYEFADLIISDILMPELDGYGLCRAVKQNPLLQNIPFIFYTATFTSQQDEQFALSLGAAQFLVKPIVMDKLLEIVAETFKSPHYSKSAKTLPLANDSTEARHTKLIRAKLEKKLVELNEERQKLLASETRFRDFAEASADCFWETDEQLKIIYLSGEPSGLIYYHLSDLAASCYNYSSTEMLQILDEHQRFTDFIVRFSVASDKILFFRISGKPLFDYNGHFIGYRGVGRDVTDMVTTNRRLEFLSSHDELTGLPNRSLFKQHLEHAIGKAKRSGQQVLLFFFDLDNFKKINDTLGQDGGDQLLIDVAKRLKEQVRSTDMVCRLGGDEFVLVIEDASPQDGHRLVRDIIDAFAKPFVIWQSTVYCIASIGVSVYPDDTEDPQSLLTYADLAMYRAKQNSHHNFEFYTNELNFIAHQWIDMEQGIRHALDQQQFYIVFQPQIDIEHQRLIGMEVLIRWQHPERGLIAPVEFIKIAEKSILINQIGEWVLETACQQIRLWLDKGYKVPRVSINISARHLRSENLINSIYAIANRYQIPTEMLCIEITEQALLEESDIVKQNMRMLKHSGFSISLDDFGMGHSSLLYLKRWSVDEVKIDRSFINGLAKNEEDRIIVKAIAALGDALGLNLIGKGVETQVQADILLASGCKNVQGYLYSPPIEAKEMDTWLKNHTATKSQ